jgi:hypothetical protein
MDRFDPVVRLRQLNAANDRITSNLLELEGDPTVAMLDAAELRGLTADRWADARRTLAGLFAAHTALKDVLETATLLTARPLLLSGSRLDELEALLEGPSIVVSDVSLRLADRGLLSDSRRVARRTAEQLITDMSAEYDSVKSVVVGVADVWDKVIPRLRAERARSLDLRRLADELGVEDASLAESSNTLREVSEAILSDPLALDVASLDDVSAALDRIEHELTELNDLIADWPDQVGDARALLDRALSVTEACAEAVALASSRVVLEDPVEVPALPNGIADALEQVIARGAEDRVGGGTDLVTWRRATLDRIAEVESVTERCRSLLGQRDDLRARLDAYAAKAARLGLLENPEVVEAFERAHATLYIAPSDLGGAGELVGQYQRLIAQRGES